MTPVFPTPTRIGRFFRVPHYHLLQDADGDYSVQTYEHARGLNAARAIRLLVNDANGRGIAVRIITCRESVCRLYGQGLPDDMSEERLHARIDQARHAARCSQGRAFP